MSNQFCKSCDKEVGAIVKRPRGRIWLYSILSLVVFILIVLLAMPSQADRALASMYGTPTSQSISDYWLIIPIVLAGFAVKAFLNKSIHCPICNSDLDGK